MHVCSYHTIDMCVHTTQIIRLSVCVTSGGANTFEKTAVGKWARQSTLEHDCRYT